MMISLIVAAADNNGIGKDNKLLWHLPSDMKFFKNTTWAMPVIMGRKTFDSLKKPLQGRLNIVITSQADWQFEGVVATTDLADAITKAGEMQTNEVFVIGGGRVYREALPMAGRIYLTSVHTNPEADTFFPELDNSEWQLLSVRDVAKDEKNAYDHSFEIWERK